MSLFDTSGALFDAPPVPRTKRREILIPSQILPQHRGEYEHIARKVLREHPKLSWVEVERESLKRLMEGMGSGGG